MRAMQRRTDFGRQMIAGQWAIAEFYALAELWSRVLTVPYPVQLDETEMLMEVVAEEGAAAPRLVQLRPDADLLADLFEQLRTTLLDLAEMGWTHGDLSPYNVLVRDDELVIIDWPQVIDIRQPAGLRAPRAGRAHDVRVVRAAWSRSRRRDALRRLRRPRCRPLTPFGRRPGASPLRRAPLQIRRGTWQSAREHS